MFEFLSETIVPLIVTLAFLYTIFRAASAVRREDIGDLKDSINEVKASQKGDIVLLSSEIKEVKSSQKEDITLLSSEIKEVKSDVKADVREINAKLDRYLFSKLEKTDDSDKGNKDK